MEHIIALVLPHQDEKEKQLEENERLRKRLQAIRTRRKQLQELQSESTPKIADTLYHLESLALQRQETVDQYQSILERRTRVIKYLEYAHKWNVTNDCFHIWHHGPFATINGFRVGGSAEGLPIALLLSAEMNANKAKLSTSPSSPTGPSAAVAAAKASTEPTSRRYMLFSGGDTKAATTLPTTTYDNSSVAPPQPSQPQLKVPWMELNSALGQVVLLLKCLAEKTHSGITFPHELHPMGSTSKIGWKRKEDGVVTAVYNLWSDDSFSLFGKRNFNSALQALLQCVAHAFEDIQQRDRTMAIPHPIAGPTAQLKDWTIGGVPFTYDATEGVEFTKACKYLLTNVKWLVAYSAKHVDR